MTGRRRTKDRRTKGMAGRSSEDPRGGSLENERLARDLAQGFRYPIFRPSTVWLPGQWLPTSSCRPWRGRRGAGW